MKILVCGGRDFNDYEFVEECLNYLRKTLKSFVVIEGGARGADSLARQWAIKYGVEYTTVMAKWDTFGKRAGLIRNFEMLEMKPDCVVAFVGGTGTAHMVSISRNSQVPVWQPTK